MFDVLRHDQDKFRAAMADGLAMSAGLKVQSPAQGAEDFRRCGFQGMAATCLRRAGYKGSELGSRIKVADLALKDAGRYGMTSSDLSAVLLDVSQKFLLKGYAESARTFWPLVDQTSATDFKERHGISLSEAPDLQLVNEAGEYPAGTLKDNQESYRVQKYGTIVSLTWESMINDDLRAITKKLQRAGATAARKESDIIWGLITGNPVMNEDGKPVFHSDHGNLEPTEVGLVDADKLSAARAQMRKQVGLGGASLDIRPTYLIVPVAQGTYAEVLLRSRANPEPDLNEGVVNPWNGLIPISEPRLDDVSTKSWYLAADTGQIDIIELAYLEDRDEPEVFQQSGFTVDRIDFKIRHCFGAGIMDFRGLFKNPGE
jgi:hypothetical protein